MEYERIDKPQTGIISPSKLRMRLMGSPNKKRKDGSNCNSSRTSPVRMEDSEFVKNCLLSSTIDELSNDVESLEGSSVTVCSQSMSNSVQSEPTGCLSKENGNRVHSDATKQSSTVVHPVKSSEDENLDYDSNASSSSFEFHKGERTMKSLKRSFSRPTSCKWNDAEKWIMNKQSVQSKASRCHSAQPQGSRIPVLNVVRVVPETAGYDSRLQNRLMMDTKRVDSFQPAAQTSFEKFSFANAGAQSNALADDCSGTPAIRAVSMRDMGTEMTPAPSQEPSRTATPLGATTPLRSPTSSLPSTPRKGNSSTENLDMNSQNQTGNGRRELSEKELKLKTREEIVALGVQLGKMNIAAWASKDAEIKIELDGMGDPEDLDRIEYEKRAAAWEEAEKSKHAARFMREEIRIQAWESQEKLKLESELRKIEAKVEELRTKAHAKMMKKITMARKRSEEKRTAAVARKNRQAEIIAAQAEFIRQTGRNPSSGCTCCGLF